MNSAKNSTIQKPFIEHLNELRARLVWCALALCVGGGVGFVIHEKLLALIQKPLGETLYFTSPTGGFNFAFKISLTFGLVVAMPVIMYQAMRFLSPLIPHKRSFHIATYMVWSLFLAYAGVVFAYVVSLPAALRFLTNFGGNNIQALISADEYFNFALAYIGGFAALFQVPLAMLFINRITPLKPGKLMGAQRYILVGSFIVAAILTPTPDPFNQMIMALPIILLYQVGIILVWIKNRKPSRTARRTGDYVHPVRPRPDLAKMILKHEVSMQPVMRPLRRTTRQIIDILPPPSTKRASPQGYRL